MESLTLDIEDLLHPLIKQRPYSSFKEGRMRDAVLDSLITVYDLIRERTSLSLDGPNLIDQAFSLANPRLIISSLETESGRNEQKGFMDLMKGAYTGIRNPNSHSLQGELDSKTAAHYLVLSSLLATKVDSSVLGCFLRTDGIYVAATGGSMSCLRFYDDREKTVMLVSLFPGSSNEGIDVDKVLSWFNKEGASDDCRQGAYEQNGIELSFDTRSSHGEILYSGTINGTSLSLRVESRINGNVSYRDYQFQKKRA
ncbi:MAG: TIGR02391 family protein [Cyanobacteriota bacterium]